MEAQNCQKIRDKVEEKLKLELVTSPPSSPAHEFSFTISLHHHQPPLATTTIHDKNNTSPPPSTVDFSPADDIFFHGHLLPLHLLSHLPVSPRSSTNSLDSFTLPIREILLDDEKIQNPIKNNTNYIETNKFGESNDASEIKGRVKSKSFSLFGLSKRRKGCEVREKEDKKKLKFDMSDVLKRYMRMVRPLLSFRGSRRQFRHQSYSFSGSLNSKGKQDHQQNRGRRGEFSAPASMRTSPTNSGYLRATGALPSSSTTSDSTMEELQAAIQAAITHCKNSISMEDKINQVP